MVDDELRVIGNVEIRVHGEPVELPPQQAKALAVLVAALASTRPEQSVSRAELVDALWPAAPDADRLSAVVSKLRQLLRRVGLTVSSGRGGSGYLLRRLDGPTGVEPTDVLDVTAVTARVARAERLLDEGRPTAAVEELCAAAAAWRGEPFTVGDDWPLPRICRAAAERLDVVARRLARTWARAGLLLGDRGALDWIDQHPALAAALDPDREVFLQRFVSALADGEPARAEALLEQRRPLWGYRDPMIDRAVRLLELVGVGARLPAAVPPGLAAPAGGFHATLAAFVDELLAARSDLLSVVGPTGPVRAVVDELVGLADAAGIRVVRAACDAVDDLAPARPLLRDLWAAALIDPAHPPDAHQVLLTDAVIDPRPSATAEDAGLLLVDTVVRMLAGMARRRPLLIVIDDAQLLTPMATELYHKIRSGLAGTPVGFVLAGVDTAPQTAATLVVPPEPGAPARPDAGDWLAAAAVSAVDDEIDPVVVAAVLDVPAGLADDGLAAAVRSGAVLRGDVMGTDPPRFADPRIRQDVLAGLAATPGRARRLHAATHRHLTTGPAARTAAPAVVARHALAARPDVPDEEVAAACLAGAAAERAADRYRAAEELADRGLALTADPGLRFALQLERGDARLARADVRAAEAAYRSAFDEATGHPDRRAVAAVRLAKRWTDPGRLDETLLQLLRATRDALGDGPDPPADPATRDLWLQLNANLAHRSTMALLAAGPVGRLPEGVELARTTLAALPAGADPVVACEVLNECRWALYDFAPPDEIRRISVRLEEAATRTDSAHYRREAIIQAVVDHLRLGELPAAMSAGERLRDHAARTGHGFGRWLQLAVDSIFDLWNGDLAAAETRILGPAMEFLTGDPGDLTDTVQQTWMGQLYWLRHEQGRMAELAELGVDRLVERRQYFPVWGAAMALLRAEVGQPEAAVDKLVALLDQTSDLRAFPPHGWAVPTLAVMAEAIDGLRGYRGGRLDVDDLAHRVDALLEPHTDEMVLAGWPTVLFGPAHRARGLLALATGRPEAAAEHFDQGMRMVGGCSAQLGWLRLHRARALLACPSHGGEARELLASALETARERGLGALAVSCERELARL